MFETGIKVHNERISMLGFIYDTVLLAKSEKELEMVFSGMQKLLRDEFGFKINESKIIVMKISGNGSRDFFKC